MRSGPVPMDLFGNRGDCIEAWVEGMEPMNRLEPLTYRLRIQPHSILPSLHSLNVYNNLLMIARTDGSVSVCSFCSVFFRLLHYASHKIPTFYGLRRTILISLQSNCRITSTVSVDQLSE